MPYVSDFAPIAVLIVVTATLAVLILALTHLIGPGRRGPVKDGTYESGMEPFGDTRRRFNVRFYIVAMLFLLFDVEIVFLYPWAVKFYKLAVGAATQDPSAAPLLHAGYTPVYLLWVGLIFFVVLTVGFVYEWRKGVFRWD